MRTSVTFPKGLAIIGKHAFLNCSLTRVEFPKSLPSIGEGVFCWTNLIDVGLLCAQKEIIPEDMLYPTHDLDNLKGGMAKNYVCNQLVAGGHNCYYWTGDHSYEVDFLL